MKLSDEIKYVFYQFLVNEISLLDFEEWLYKNESKLAAISEELSLELISVNYKEYDAIRRVKNIIEEGAIDKQDFAEWGLKRQLQILEDKDAWRSTLFTLYHFYWDDNIRFSFLMRLCDYIAPVLFRGDHIGVPDFTGEIREEIIETYLYPAILTESKKVLHQLATGKIVISGENTFESEFSYSLNDNAFEEIVEQVKVRLSQSKST